MREIPEIIRELQECEENGTLMSGSILSSKQKIVYENPSPCFEDEPRDNNPEATTSLMESQLDQQFQNTDNIYRSLFECSPDGIVIVDVTGKILSCNPAALKMTGYKTHDLIGKHFSKTKILGLKEIPNMLELFSKILGGNYQGPFELKYYRKDGSCFWSEVHISLLKNKGHACGLIAISRDITQRKEAERRIHHSEKRYRELYEGSRDGFALVDMNGSIIESNSSFQMLLGYSAEELRSKTYKDITVNKWHALEAEILEKQVLPRGYSDMYEKEYRHKNGTIIPIEIRTYLLEEEGTPQGIWAFVRDISERKQKECESEESKSHFHHLFNAIADPIVIVDRHGKFLEISEGVFNLTGYTSEELIGKNFLRTKLVTTRSKTILLANLAKRMTGIHIAPYEIDVVTKQGEIIPFEINAARINYKDHAADMVIFRDVRERRKTETALRESEEKFRLLSEQSLMGIAIIQGSDIKYVNEAAAIITEYSKDEMVNKGVGIIQNLLHPEDKSFVMNQLKKKLHGDSDIVPRYTYRIITKTGKLRWVEQFSKTIDFSGEKADLVTIIDITEKKEAEEQIKQQNIRLRKIDKLKTDFLNITSHELRTPMTAMKGYLQILNSETLGSLNGEQINALQVILRNTNRLDHLVHDILDTSRLESGTMKFIPMRTEIPNLINDVVETMQLSAILKNIQIDATVQDDLPELIIDQERIKQVFDNIVNNAIKFSPNDSKIQIRVRKGDDVVQFAIQDIGKGIAAGHHEKIFETFYQVESGMDRTFGGTGLGLTISRGIVLGHGGKIWVESTLGEGSTFKFTLPITPVQDVEGTFKRIDIFSIKNEYKEKEHQE